MRRTRKSTDELERTGEGDLEFAGLEVFEGISSPWPSLSTAESSIKVLFFLTDSGTAREVVQEKNEKREKKHVLVQKLRREPKQKMRQDISGATLFRHAFALTGGTVSDRR